MISVALVQYCFDTVLLHTAEASREHLDGWHPLQMVGSTTVPTVGMDRHLGPAIMSAEAIVYVCIHMHTPYRTAVDGPLCHCVQSSSAPVMPMWLCISVHTRGGELSSLVLCSIHYVQHLLCQQ